MRKIFIVVICLLSFGAHAQDRLEPVYFISGHLTSIDSFNKFVLEAIPDFHLISMDSSNRKTWTFSYTNNEVYNNRRNTIYFSYELEPVSGNPALRIPNTYGIGDIQITGEFLTLAKIYNRMFRTKISPEELEKKCPVYGPIGAKHWFRFEPASGGNYWMFFRKQ